LPGSLFVRGREMERKIAVEVELSEEDAKRFADFIENGCYNRDKYLAKMVIGAIQNALQQTEMAMKRKPANTRQSSLG
jgi:hypothetical protein